MGEVPPGSIVEFPVRVKVMGPLAKSDKGHHVRNVRITRDRFGRVDGYNHGNLAGLRDGFVIDGKTPITYYEPPEMRAEVRGGEVDPVKGDE